MPAARPLREVLAGPHAAAHGPLPKLQLPGDDSYLSPFIETAADIIAEAHSLRPDTAPLLFRRSIVPIIPVPGDNRFIPMKAEYFVSWAERHFRTYKIRYDASGDPHDVLRPMTKENGRSMLESLDFTMAMPPIKRTFPIPVPLIPEDGGPMKLCPPGYEPDSGSFVFDADFPHLPEMLNPADGLAGSDGYYDDRMTLRDGVTGLHRIFHRMPFSDWSEPQPVTEDSPFYDPENPHATHRFSRSLAVQIMSMLAMFAGGCVPPQASRLGFAVNANIQRSGKTLCVKIAVGAVFGSCKLQSWRENDEDMIKILDAETLAASSYLVFDNIRSLIASGPLEGFMTTPVWTGRILGQSEMFKAENNAVMFFTANNASLGTDMQERTLIVDLYVETADRQNRGEEIPRADRLDDVWLSKPENRRHILSCLWAIVRHWEAARRPRATGLARRGFEEWCETIGGMVEFAGFGDPLEKPTDLENCGDSETEDIRALVEYVSDGVRHAELTFQGIVHICWERGLIPWCMHGNEDYMEDMGKVSLRLNSASISRFGILLQRNCSGQRGSVHAFRTADGKFRHVRFRCQGKGRSRRFHFEEITPEKTS